MRKLLRVATPLLLALFIASCGDKSVKSPNFDGVYIGGNDENVITSFLNNGYELVETYVSDGLDYARLKGNYLGHSCGLLIGSKEGVCFGLMSFFKESDLEKATARYNSLLKCLEEEYGLAAQPHVDLSNSNKLKGASIAVENGTVSIYLIREDSKRNIYNVHIYVDNKGSLSFGGVVTFEGVELTGKCQDVAKKLKKKGYEISEKSDNGNIMLEGRYHDYGECYIILRASDDQQTIYDLSLMVVPVVSNPAKLTEKYTRMLKDMSNIYGEFVAQKSSSDYYQLATCSLDNATLGLMIERNQKNNTYMLKFCVVPKQQ